MSRRSFRFVLVAFATVGLVVASAVQPQQATRRSTPMLHATPIASTFGGKVSYYGDEVAGRKTSSGERFDPRAFTMAHRTLPFGTRVRVTNLQNNKSVIVRVNDRGPGIADRVADVSESAARELRMLHSGVVEARLEVLRTPNTNNA